MARALVRGPETKGYPLTLAEQIEALANAVIDLCNHFTENGTLYQTAVPLLYSAQEKAQSVLDSNE